MPSSSSFGVQKTSAQAVLSWYDKQENSKFIIYRGIKENDSLVCGGYFGTDKEEGLAYLDQFMAEVEPTDYNIYFLKTQPSKATSKAVTPGITFQLHKAESGYMAGIGATANNQVMNEVLNEIRALRAERLAELQSDSEEEEEETEEESDLVAGLLKTPQMQNMLIGALQSMFMPKATQPVQAMGAIETDQDALNEAVQALLAKGATVTDLQKLAAMEQGQFSWLLSMLRK